MTPRRAAVAAAIVAVLAVVASVVAVQLAHKPGVLAAATGAPATGVLAADRSQSAPELVGVKDFDNTAPVTLAGLRAQHKVVLVDFWTYTCINCRRTFPFLRALSTTYAGAGLTVLGVHSPEFGFEKDHGNVAKAVQRLGVTWPVAEDPEMATWNAFGNQYWPADYLIDTAGKVRYAHFGEGGDDEVEAAVRSVLAEDGRRVGARIGQVVQLESPGNDLTPETYFGAERGARYVVGGKAVPAGRTLVRRDRLAGRDLLALFGTVTGEAESLQLGAGASVTQRFHAKDVYATAAPTGGPVTVEVTLDGRPVPTARRGSALREVAGRTVVTIGRDDLYPLLTGPAVGDGILRLIARSAGARLFTFTYGG